AAANGAAEGAAGAASRNQRRQRQAQQQPAPVIDRARSLTGREQQGQWEEQADDGQVEPEDGSPAGIAVLGDEGSVERAADAAKLGGGGDQPEGKALPRRADQVRGR